MNRSGRYITQPTGYKAFIPEPLPPQDLIIQGDLQAYLLEATNLLARLDGLAYTLPNTDLLILMFVKKEALLSSQIEGTQASLEDLFEFERGETLENINDVEEVINYIKALNTGLERLEKIPMSLRLIKELHAILMKGVRGAEKTPGEFRRSQNWIGPAGSTLKNAVFVPPPPDQALKALGDLELYLHKKSKLPVLIDCALMHYQFETIHPFLDGNGRLGRLLITFYLCWKGALQKPLLYLSYYLKQNRQEYYDRLTLVRNKGNYEQWLEFFLKGIIQTSQEAIDQTKKILELAQTDKQKLWKTKASSPLVMIFLDKLFYTPVVTISDVQKMFNTSHQTAANLITLFQKTKILKEVTGKKRGRRFVYTQYMEILAEGTKPFEK